MRGRRSILRATLIALSAVALQLVQAQNPPITYAVKYAKSTVEVKLPGKKSWERITGYSSLPSGTQIRTVDEELDGDSSTNNDEIALELEYLGVADERLYTTISLLGKTSATVYGTSPGEGYLDLTSGSLWINEYATSVYFGEKVRPRFRVKRRVTLAGTGTHYKVSSSVDGGSIWYVDEGYVNAWSMGNEANPPVVYSKGQTGTASADGTVATPDTDTEATR